ncbi:TetR/AcrR family transcriptional regulator [Bremerella sp. JC817]|uniref:TetR/AcrR family transcriptional regulator n=1 Tax=Bremerella sp. JC817 TaxID=3231756 RepID=UPI0034584C3F
MPLRSSTSTSRSKPGRPPVYSEEERSQLLLRAAEEAFTTIGYGAATMEEIARLAGMSKKTLYALFPDKESLFEGVVGSLGDCPWENPEAPPLLPPAEELRRRLLAMVTFILSPRQIRLTRLLIAEAERTPKLAHDFHQRVISKGRQFLKEAIRQAADAGIGPKVEDYEQWSSTVLGAALARHHLSALFGKAHRAPKAQVEAQVDTALRAFGYL